MLNCRFCKKKLKDIIINLGLQPSANRLLTKEEVLRIKLGDLESLGPLTVYLCNNCSLVQLGESEIPEKLFTKNYLYYSSFSQEWLNHAKKFVEWSIKNFNLTKDSKVLEIGSNDGYLLQHYVLKNITCLGVDPAGMVAKIAKKKNVETVVDFFTKTSAEEIIKKYGKQDLLIGNNVFAHIPNIRETIQSLKFCMSDNAVISLEVPHLKNLVKEVLFDTIYDEHYFYFSLVALQKIFMEFDLKIFKVQETLFHGGSVRIFICDEYNENYLVDKSVEQMIKKEKNINLDNIFGYVDLKTKVEKIRHDAKNFLKKEKEIGHKIVAYGAPAKGNVFLNFCDIKANEIEFVVDETPVKQGLFLPGSYIPVFPPEKLKQFKPDVIVILPWNFREEILFKIKKINNWEAKIVTFIPNLKVLE